MGSQLARGGADGSSTLVHKSEGRTTVRVHPHGAWSGARQRLQDPSLFAQKRVILRIKFYKCR